MDDRSKKPPPEARENESGGERPAPGDQEAELARRIFIRAGLIAVPAALAAFTVSRPARAQASCKPHWCRPGIPCNPDLCGPQICNPAD